MIQNSIQVSDSPSIPQPKGLIPFRRFAEALNQFSDFHEFRDTLKRIIVEDSGYAGLLELEADIGTMADTEVGQHFEMDSLVVPLRAKGEQGYIRFMGNEDGRPFDAEDLMWIGAIGEFVSLAYANSKAQHQTQAKARVFQYLINQLPLGVVCFDAEGALLVENKLASRLLGESGAELMRGALSEHSLQDQGKVRLHLEVNDKLLYSEGRRLEVEAGVSVTAFVLHDLSGQREKLMLQLDRSVYRAESRGAPLTVAVFEDRTEAGRLYQQFKAFADALQVEQSNILPLDAYSCACIFPDTRLRSVRYLLKKTLANAMDSMALQGALLADWERASEASPAMGMIEQAQERRVPAVDLLRPAILVLDHYTAVAETLDLIAGDLCAFEALDSLDMALAQIESGEFDGIFFDVDAFGGEALERLHTSVERAGSGFQIYYISHKQPSMVYSENHLGVETTVFQKPFDAEQITNTLKLHFDFA